MTVYPDRLKTGLQTAAETVSVHLPVPGDLMARVSIGAGGAVVSAFWP